MLVKLSGTQIAYIRKSINKDEWQLIPSGNDADFSYKQIYVIPINKLTHKIEKVIFITTSIGEIIGDIIMRPKKSKEKNHFPEMLNRNQVAHLFDMTNISEFETAIRFALKESEILPQITKKYEYVNDFFTTNPNISPNEWDTNFKGLLTEIDKIDFIKGITDSIEKNINQMFDDNYVFEVETRVDVKNEGPRKYLEDKYGEYLKQIREENAGIEKEYRGADIEIRNELRRALIDVMKTSPNNKKLELINLITELEHNPNKQLHNKAKQILEASVVENNKQLESGDFKKTASKITLTLSHFTSDESSKDDIDEAISKCSVDYFDINNLSIDEFLNDLYANWKYDKEPKEESEVKILVEESLQNIINKK